MDVIRLEYGGTKVRSGILLLMFLFCSCIARASHGSNDLVNRLYKTENVLSEVLEELQKEEMSLWEDLAVTLRNHLSCCVHKSVIAVNNNATCFKEELFFTARRIYLSVGTSLTFIKKILSISQICDKGYVEPPIRNLSIQRILSQIEQLRLLQNKVRKYISELIAVRSQLKVAIALQSSRLPLLKKRAIQLLKEIDFELSQF